MRLAPALALALILGLFQCSLLVSSKEISGYVLTSERFSLNKDSSDSPIYKDSNARDLILHNLGLFDAQDHLSTSSQSIISKLGSKDLLSAQKLNYVFLLEGTESTSLLSTETRKLRFNHKSASFNDEKSLLEQLFSKESQNSVVSRLAKTTEDQKAEAYLFSNDDSVAAGFSDSRLVSFASEKGVINLVDQKSGQSFKISQSLQSCVDTIFKEQYTVNLREGVIQEQQVDGSIIVLKDGKEEFVEYMGDLCSVVGISTLVRRDPNPTLFVFHVSSLGRLEKFVSEEQRKVLVEMFNVAYSKFLKNVLGSYSFSEVSGQVFLLSPRAGAKVQANFVLNKNVKGFYQAKERVLADTGLTAGETDPTTKIIFTSVLIAFVFVVAWVCFEMFNMDIQKDSVVYAKFLAADYFRR